MIDVEVKEPKARVEIVLKNAMMCGFFVMACFLIIGMVGFPIAKNFQTISFTLFGVFLLLMLITQIQVRIQCYDGALSYGKAFTTGMLVSGIVIFMITLFYIIFFGLIATHVPEEMKALQIQKMTEMGTSFKDATDQIEQASFFLSPLGLGFINFIFYNIAAFILSLIASIFTQRIL